MNLREACVLIAAMAMALCCVSSVSARHPGGGLLGLTLPSFPLPPKADRAMLHIRETNADADFESDVTPRFQSVDDSEEDGAEVEVEADAEEQTEETETETEAEEEQVEEDAEAETEAEEEQPAVVIPQMRFRSMQQRQRYDANALPAGPMPVQPASQWDAYARARVNPASIGEPAFQPIHNSERQFVGAYPAPSLAPTPNGYAWAAARPAPANYQFGNLIAGVPVNANVGALYPRAPIPTPAPAPMPAATSFMEANARVNAGAGAGAALYRPYAPGMAPANTPSRSASADLYASSYKSYSSANWPSSVPPPAAYYLPPDVVV